MASPMRFGSGGGGGGVQFAWAPLTPVVKRLIVANVAVFAVFVMLGFNSSAQATFVHGFGLDPMAWRDWFPLLPVWQLVTYGFLHEPTGLEHVFFNMITLYFFGGMVESIVGARRFAVHYFIALVVGGLGHLVIMPLFGMYNPAIGASGACLAMVVAAATFRPNTTVILLVFPIQLKWVAAFLVAGNAFAVITQLQGTATTRDAIYVHLAGALYGYLAVKRRWIQWEPISAFERRRSIAQEERRLSDADRMDELLARIKREGMGSLSSSDRDFLKRQSERGR